MIGVFLLLRTHILLRDIHLFPPLNIPQRTQRWSTPSHNCTHSIWADYPSSVLFLWALFKDMLSCQDCIVISKSYFFSRQSTMSLTPESRTGVHMLRGALQRPPPAVLHLQRLRKTPRTQTYAFGDRGRQCEGIRCQCCPACENVLRGSVWIYWQIAQCCWENWR